MSNVFGYIAVMALVTYLIRMVPLVLLKKEITNTWVKSFLYYVPYVTLAVMTFPAILEATDSPASGAAALVAAVILAYRGKSLIQVAAAACAVVFVLELFSGAIVYRTLFRKGAAAGFLRGGRRPSPARIRSVPGGLPRSALRCEAP